MKRSALIAGRQYKTMHTAQYTTQQIQVLKVYNHGLKEFADFVFLQQMPDGTGRCSLRHTVGVKQLCAMCIKELPSDQYIRPKK